MARRWNAAKGLALVPGSRRQRPGLGTAGVGRREAGHGRAGGKRTAIRASHKITKAQKHWPDLPVRSLALHPPTSPPVQARFLAGSLRGARAQPWAPAVGFGWTQARCYLGACSLGHGLGQGPSGRRTSRPCPRAGAVNSDDGTRKMSDLRGHGGSRRGDVSSACSRVRLAAVGGSHPDPRAAKRADCARPGTTCPGWTAHQGVRKHD